jgi:hypothetical protein
MPRAAGRAPHLSSAAQRRRLFRRVLALTALCLSLGACAVAPQTQPATDRGRAAPVAPELPQDAATTPPPLYDPTTAEPTPTATVSGSSDPTSPSDSFTAPTDTALPTLSPSPEDTATQTTDSTGSATTATQEPASDESASSLDGASGGDSAGASGEVFDNCTDMHGTYPHGVGLPDAVDHTRSGANPVTNFYRDADIYNANSDSDADGDGIACERH